MCTVTCAKDACALLFLYDLAKMLMRLFAEEMKNLLENQLASKRAWCAAVCLKLLIMCLLVFRSGNRRIETVYSARSIIINSLCSFRTF